jgi:hypothetical protein
MNLFRQNAHQTWLVEKMLNGICDKQTEDNQLVDDGNEIG